MTALEFNIFQKKLESFHETKMLKQFLQNTSKWFNTGGYFCIGFIDFMLKGKSLLDNTNLFVPNKNKNN